MGTRHVIIVKLDETIAVAQYGQWDGYLEGQGNRILEFLNGISSEMDTFKSQLRKCCFLNDEEYDAIMNKFTDDGWMTIEQVNEWKKDESYRLYSRDTSSDILKFIFHADNQEIPLRNEYNFAADSLFCEYAYVIDLDSNNLEVYTGFNKKPLSENERFFHLQHEKTSDYYPVKLAFTMDISGFPLKFSDEHFAALEKDGQ